MLLYITSSLHCYLNKLRINSNLFFQKLRKKDSVCARLQTECNGLKQQLEVCHCKL